MFSDGVEDFVMDEKTVKTTPVVAGLQRVAMTTVEKISQLLLQNCHLSLRMLADEVNIDKDTVRKILVEDMRKRNICSRFVPYF
jgi:response regulator of citrate/malate metabolism